MARFGQLSNLRGSQRGTAALAKLLLVSPLMRFLDQQSGYEEDATNFKYKVKEGTMSVQTRDLGGNYTSATLTPVGNQNGVLYLHGFQIDIDQSHLADDARGLQDLAGWIDNELPDEVDSFARLYEALLMNGSGSGSPSEIMGLKTILSGSNITGYSVNNLINAKDAASSGTYLDLTDPANYDAFVEYLVGWLEQVENPTGILMNGALKAKMYTVAKKQGILGQSLDQFGKPVDTFNGVPMVKLLDTSILNTEPDDTPTTPLTNTTSLYIVAPQEKNLSLVTNSGLDFEDYDKLEAKQSGRLKGEIRAAWKIQRKNSVRRVRNIKAR